MKKLVYILIVLCITFALVGCNKEYKIDWIDFIKFNDIKYSREYSTKSVSSELIEKKIGDIKFQVAGNIKDSDYKTKNGDAAFLKAGTEIYKLKDYNENFRIAVKVDEEYRLYEVSENPNAQKIKDILDIEDKVAYIGMNSEKDGKTELGLIKNNEKIRLLVDMILNSEIKENYNEDGIRYFIDFHLKDGTSVIKSLNIETGNFDNKTTMSEEFIKELRMIINEEVFNINFFKENLNQLGYKYNESNLEVEGFLSVKPVNLQIDEEQILIYQYNNKTEMEKDAGTISSDGSIIGYSMVDWMSGPHFFKKGSVIVEYAGKNSKLLTNIREIMGMQFAGR